MTQSLKEPSFGLGDVEILEHDVVFNGFFQMQKFVVRHRKFEGGWSEMMSRELFERGHAVVVLPYDPVRDEVVLLEQFRIGALHTTQGPWLLEFVAGMFDDDENSEEVATREMREEAGCELGELEFITEYMVSPGGTSERVSLYCGRIDASKAEGIHGLDEEHEDIRVVSVPYAELVDLFEAGRINSAAPIIGVQWLMLHRERLRRQWAGSSE
ncbi:MAG: ADP-ribose diphosphatase [Gammaproteobacteria bacterium]|nr:ADP-ribose diphosphatase [Gammaproteobacteria bacterium]